MSKFIVDNGAYFAKSGFSTDNEPKYNMKSYKLIYMI